LINLILSSFQLFLPLFLY